MPLASAKARAVASSRWYVAATVWPAACRPKEIACPKPRVPPVTKATLVMMWLLLVIRRVTPAGRMADALRCDHALVRSQPHAGGQRRPVDRAAHHGR